MWLKEVNGCNYGCIVILTFALYVSQVLTSGLILYEEIGNDLVIEFGMRDEDVGKDCGGNWAFWLGFGFQDAINVG